MQAPYNGSTIKEVTNLTFCIADETEYDPELSELMGMEDSDHEIKVSFTSGSTATISPRPRPLPSPSQPTLAFPDISIPVEG